MVSSAWCERFDEVGASAVEYGLLVAGVAGLIAAVVFLFGNAVHGLFTDTCSSINSGSSGQMAQLTC
jgi:pilus assembly protein Flp/PilA